MPDMHPTRPVATVLLHAQMPDAYTYAMLPRAPPGFLLVLFWVFLTAVLQFQWFFK